MEVNKMVMKLSKYSVRGRQFKTLANAKVYARFLKKTEKYISIQNNEKKTNIKTF